MAKSKIIVRNNQVTVKRNSDGSTVTSSTKMFREARDQAVFMNNKPKKLYFTKIFFKNKASTFKALVIINYL